jgi:hypothetical protein
MCYELIVFAILLLRGCDVMLLVILRPEQSIEQLKGRCKYWLGYYGLMAQTSMRLGCAVTLYVR